MSEQTQDPICGNCGNALSRHHIEPYPGEEHPRAYCYVDTSGDVFTDEPTTRVLADWLANSAPLSYAGLVSRWQYENGHEKGVVPIQLQVCKHGTAFRYECEECVAEVEVLEQQAEALRNTPLEDRIKMQIKQLIGVAKTKTPVTRGWRFFNCEHCYHRWVWPTRDHDSDSGETCPKCGHGDETPFGSVVDASIPVDDMGNITIPYNTNREDWIAKQKEDAKRDTNG